MWQVTCKAGPWRCRCSPQEGASPAGTPFSFDRVFGPASSQVKACPLMLLLLQLFQRVPLWVKVEEEEGVGC